MLYTITGATEVLALGAASVHTATPFPAGTTHVRLAATGNGHFRTGAGAPVAAAADPIIGPGFEVFWPAHAAEACAVIQDAASTGNVSVTPVAFF